MILSAGNGDGDFTLIQTGINSTLNLQIPSLSYSIGNFVINIAEPTATLSQLNMQFFQHVFKSFTLKLPSQGLDAFGRCTQAPAEVNLGSLRSVDGSLELTDAVRLDSLAIVAEGLRLQGPAGEIALGAGLAPNSPQ